MRKAPEDRKNRISVALKRRTIKAVDDAASLEGRTRSDFIQRILDKHLPAQEPTEIPFKMG
jgi:uncharacterized protein (DUF1778 family)